jgi:hypothetical protein
MRMFVPRHPVLTQISQSISTGSLVDSYWLVLSLPLELSNTPPRGGRKSLASIKTETASLEMHVFSRVFTGGRAYDRRQFWPPHQPPTVSYAPVVDSAGG